MATKATTKRLTIARNQIGHPRVRYDGIGKRWHVYCVVEGDEADWCLSKTLRSKKHAYQMMNRIKGEGTIEAKLWTKMDFADDPFEVVK